MKKIRVVFRKVFHLKIGNAYYKTNIIFSFLLKIITFSFLVGVSDKFKVRIQKLKTAAFITLLANFLYLKAYKENLNSNNLKHFLFLARN